MADSMSSRTGQINFNLGASVYLGRLKKINTPLVSSYEKSNLFTLFHVSKEQIIDAATLQCWREDYLNNDDVFCPEFLGNVVFGGVSSSEISLTIDAKKTLKAWQTRKLHYEPNLHISSGPYVHSDGCLFTVWKLYDDYQLAFVESVWPSPNDEKVYDRVNVAGGGWRNHGIVVPARSYSYDFALSKDSSQAPSCSIKGLRIAVKDNFDMKGIKTSLCNRAFLDTYPPPDSSAEVINRLIEGGASIVGKTYMSAFAMMEHPTQSVDFQAPFHPRGDGYLITGGSSGGSAAAIATYDWVDLAICSDTTGSARIPAFQTGIFGFRPSTGMIPGDGLHTAWAAVDTPAWFGRDLTTFPLVLRALMGHKESYDSKWLAETEVVAITDFIPENNLKERTVLDDFLQSIGSVNGVTTRQANIYKDWRNSSPGEEKDLDQYLKEIMPHGWYYAAYNSFGLFRKHYRELHGHNPFVTEVIRWYWDIGRKVTLEQHQEIMERLSVFSEWFSATYHSKKKNTVFISFLDKVQPKYRDQYPGNNNPITVGLKASYLAPILKAPELALPVGQIPYYSRITDGIEQLPVVISLMAVPGSDMEFLHWTIATLKKLGRPTTIKTGKTAF